MIPKTIVLSEDFLHYAWRALHFDVTALQSTDGRSIRIRQQGIWNHDQGPDFLHAHLEIGGVEWHGHVELHLQTEDWYRHGHERDPHYNNTVLHVVLDSKGSEVLREDGTSIPELALRPVLSPHLLQAYLLLQQAPEAIPCATQIHRVGGLHRLAWIERLGVSRILAKAQAMSVSEKKDWDQVLWEEVAAMMGGPVNREAFRALSLLLPYPLLARYREQPHRIEALLFGLAGLLEAPAEGDAYHAILCETWDFLRKKHGLPRSAPVALRFLRMRPAAFPTLRLAQLASWLRAWPHPARLLQGDGFHAFLHTPLYPDPYWKSRYHFGPPGKEREKPLGESQKIILLINVLIPLAFLYHRFHGRSHPDHMVENILSSLPPEDNRIIRAFHKLNIFPENVLHSQGLIELKKNYCDRKACLECQIGHQLLKKGLKV